MCTFYCKYVDKNCLIIFISNSSGNRMPEVRVLTVENPGIVLNVLFLFRMKWDESNTPYQYMILKTFLEMLLLELKGLTISYASFKKKEADKEERELISDIDKLSKNLTSNNLASFDRKTHQLKELRKAKLKGNIIRSKAKWVTEGKNQPNISAAWKKEIL